MTDWLAKSMRKNHRRGSRHRKLHLDVLEDRRVLAVFTVTSLSDGPIAIRGSLRPTILAANRLPGADEIVFAPSLQGTINLQNGQMAITDALTIKGPGISIDGGGQSRIFELDVVGERVQLNDLTLANGKADVGGAIRVLSGELEVNSINFLGNKTTFHGGAVHALGSSASMTIQGAYFFDNVSNLLGGAVFSAYSNATVSNSVFLENRALSSNGGAAFFAGAEFDVSSSTFQANVAGNYGGAIAVENAGAAVSFHLEKSTIRQNLAWGAGGIFISNIGDDTQIRDSLVDGNKAIFSGGGGIRTLLGGLEITNTTISNNFTPNRGGGIYRQAGNISSNFVNLTIVNNTSLFDGGGIYNEYVLAVGGDRLQNSIVASNSAPTGPDVNSVFVGFDASSTNNLFGVLDPTDPLTAGSIFGTAATPLDPQLGPLTNNGGPTQTFALLAGSPAIDAGWDAFAASAGLTTDQRGENRFADGNGDGTVRVDIGAFELQQGKLRSVSLDSTTVVQIPLASRIGNGLAGMEYAANRTMIDAAFGLVPTPKEDPLSSSSRGHHASVFDAAIQQEFDKPIGLLK